jgi:biopolymer transport protein ExbB/TolQ
MSGVIATMNEGGVFMYFILSFSIFALTMIIRKVYLLWVRYRLAEDEITKAVLRQIESNNYARAIQYCNGKNHPLTAIIKAALLRANKSEKEIRRGVEVAAADEIPRFKRGVAFLPHLANVSTMVGLLGTIRGLIHAFSGMEGGDAVKRQEALSTGIALAFNATFFALSVAATLVLAFVILNTKQNKMVEKMEHVVTTVVDMIVTKNARMLSSQKGS